MCLFQNPLKEQTKQSLLQLKDAKLDIKIVTGDNILTAMAVGEQCQLLSKFTPQGLIHYDHSAIQLTYYQLNLQNYDKQQVSQYSIPVQTDDQSTLTTSTQIQDDLVNANHASSWVQEL